MKEIVMGNTRQDHATQFIVLLASINTDTDVFVRERLIS